VLLVAEGIHERAGALERLVHRIAMADLHCDSDNIQRNDIHAHNGQGQGYFKKAVRWLLHARAQHYEAVVLLIDEDGRPERTEQLDHAQQFSGVTIRRAMGMAIRTFDAWMLADEQALSTVLGYTVQRQPDPETIKDPKGQCATLLEKARPAMAQRDMYTRIAEEADVDALRSRCSRGFRPFADRVRALRS